LLEKQREVTEAEALLANQKEVIRFSRKPLYIVFIGIQIKNAKFKITS
jgi:hypothetical protein